MPNIKPTQPSFEKQLKPVDKAVENKTQVKTDKLSQSMNEKKAGEKATLNPAEKIAIGAAATAMGGAAAAAVCLVDDDVLDKVKETGSKIKEGVKEHYKHSPEEKAFDSVKKFGKQAGEAIEEFGKQAGEAIEEFVDDLKDGRVARDVSKSAKRFVRDHFTEQSKTDKFSNLVKDAAEDLKDAAADLADDIKDGRVKGKIN